ncbi:MAG: hypothetical protein WC825_02375 [Gallionellaceae bacterium]
MANDDITQRMIRWAEWLLRGDGGGLGFPRECSYTRMQQRGDGGYCSPEVDLESAETEKAVQALEQDLKLAVQVYYLASATRETQAQYLKCHVRTMERRVERAHVQIMQLLDDVSRKRRVKNLSRTC